MSKVAYVVKQSYDDHIQLSIEITNATEQEKYAYARQFGGFMNPNLVRRVFFESSLLNKLLDGPLGTFSTRLSIAECELNAIVDEINAIEKSKECSIGP